MIATFLTVAVVFAVAVLVLGWLYGRVEEQAYIDIVRRSEEDH